MRSFRGGVAALGVMITYFRLEPGLKDWCKGIVKLGMFVGALGGIAAVPMCYFEMVRDARARDAEIVEMVHDAMDAAGFSPTLPNTWFKGRRFADEINKNASSADLRRIVNIAKAKEFEGEVIVSLELFLLFSLDDVDQIVAHARALPSDIPESSKLLVAGIVIMQNTPHRDDALDLMEEAVQLEPENNELLVGVAWMLHGAGRNDRAISIFRTVLSREPTNLDYINRFAHVLMEVNALDESEALLQEAASREPDARTFNTLGCIRTKQGRYREALTYFEEAIKRDGANGMYHRNAALMHRLFRDRSREQYYIEQAKKYGWNVHPEANYMHIMDGD